MLHVAFLRSPEPHARIARIDVTAARAMLGVAAVYTGEEMRASMNPMHLQVPMPGLKTPAYHPLAIDKVRFVGDPVAMVIADSRYLAEDACERIEVEYEPLSPVPSADHALAPGAPTVFDEFDDNVVFAGGFSFGDPDRAFAEADRVVHETFRQHRFANVPMETRGGVSEYNPATGEMVYHVATQSPHAHRFILAGLLNQPVHRMRVLAGDVGGAFGLKGMVFREDAAVCLASKQLGRPVKWIEDRSEHLMASGHAREETVDVEIAVTNDGRILGLKAKLVMDQGAYPVLPVPSALFGLIVGLVMPGPYRFQHYRFDQTIVATNKCSYVPYRGPWAVETLVRERLLDIVARELDLDPVELRLRNLVTKDEQPTHMASGPTLARVSALETLERAVASMDYQGFRAVQRQLREEGRYVGLGIATFIEPAPGPPDFGQALNMDLGKERAHVRIEPDGRVTVITAQAPHGQSHETTLAQVAAQELGVPFDDVRVLHGDTQITPFSLIGTGGSRAATMASGAVLYATRAVKEQVLQIAAQMLEISPDDLEIANGIVSVKGVPARAIPLAQIAMMAYLAPAHLPPGVGPGLEARYDFDGGEGGWSQATHCCWVEVDPQTGQVQIQRYLVVEDCGTIINPAVVDGQIRGGIAQGIGGVLYEHAFYDENGQFLTTTFMDYLLPTAMEIPPIEIEHLETPPVSPVNFRGVGEGGAILAPPALTNAIEDALSPFGVKITTLPLTPTRILELIGGLP
ncbi:MAG: xanthine dehydrogenase family protein [Chloroflexi bacterium]|nr:xanthine dehydrogenase family protein [Chloroflexota bacterium]